MPDCERVKPTNTPIADERDRLLVETCDQIRLERREDGRVVVSDSDVKLAVAVRLEGEEAAAAQERLWRNENFGKITLDIE